MLLQETGCIMVSVALLLLAIYAGVSYAIWKREQTRKIRARFPHLFSQDFEKAQYFAVGAMIFVAVIAWVLSLIDK